MRFALLAGPHIDEFVVVGGLNPDFLAPAAPTVHQGTTDVDLLFELGMIYDREDQDFAWLDRVVEQASFTERRGSGGWQWSVTLGTALIRFDILCDVLDSRGQTIALPGAHKVAAQNLDGPAAALVSPVTRTLRVSETVRADIPVAPATVDMVFASLGGYIIAKSSALLSRALPKDAYDLMFVILYNPGGPREAAAAAAGIDGYDTVVRSAVQSFLSRRERAEQFAEAMAQAGDDSTESQLRTDAAVGAQQFLEGYDRALDERGAGPR